MVQPAASRTDAKPRQNKIPAASSASTRLENEYSRVIAADAVHAYTVHIDRKHHRNWSLYSPQTMLSIASTTNPIPMIRTVHPINSNRSCASVLPGNIEFSKPGDRRVAGTAKDPRIYRRQRAEKARLNVIAAAEIQEAKFARVPWPISRHRSCL
jgi:hypothetical protein